MDLTSPIRFRTMARVEPPAEGFGAAHAVWGDLDVDGTPELTDTRRGDVFRWQGEDYRFTYRDPALVKLVYGLRHPVDLDGDGR
ncbi:MAG: hypothetical protein AB1445_14600 [Bacillota bacterium]